MVGRGGGGWFGGMWDKFLGKFYLFIKSDIRKIWVFFFNGRWGICLWFGDCGSYFVVSIGTIKSNEDGRIKKWK